MTYTLKTHPLQTLYGTQATDALRTPPKRRPGDHIRDAPKQLGFGRPAQNSAGQP